MKNTTTAGCAIMIKKIMKWTGKLYKLLNAFSVIALKRLVMTLCIKTLPVK